MKKLFMGLMLSMILVLGSVGLAACVESKDPSLTIAAADKTVTLKIGETKELTATKVDIDEAIIWSSSDASVATVNATTGETTAVSKGTTTITASAGGKSDTSAITVIDPSITIAAADKTATIAVGNKKTLVANKIDIDTAIVWSTSNADVATVNASTGEVTAVAKGTATITATAGEKSDTSAITVIDPSLTIAAADKTISIAVGDKKTLVANKVDIAESIAWSTSNADVATVNILTGEITAVAVGTATITATAGAKTDTATVTVFKPISIDEETFSLESGSKKTLVATLNGIEADVVWSTSNAAIAAVNSATGEVTARAKGTAIITATAGTYTATATVSVLNTAADRAAILNLKVKGDSTVNSYYLFKITEQFTISGDNFNSVAFNLILDLFFFASSDTHNFTIAEFENALAAELAIYIAYFNEYVPDFIAEIDVYSDSNTVNNSPNAVITNILERCKLDTVEELYGEEEIAIIEGLNQAYEGYIAELLPVLDFDRLSGFDVDEYYRITRLIRALTDSIDLPTLLDETFTFTFDFGDAELDTEAVIAILAVELAYLGFDEAFLTNYFADGVPLTWTINYRYMGFDEESFTGLSLPGYMVYQTNEYHILAALTQALAMGELIFTDPDKAIERFESAEGEEYTFASIPLTLLDSDDLEALGLAAGVDLGTGIGYTYPSVLPIVFRSTNVDFIAVFA